MKTKRIASLIVSLAMALTMFVMPASANAQSYLSGDTDFNGKITSADFLTVQLSLVGQTQLVGNAEQSADVDGNNAVTSAVSISSCTVGISYFSPKMMVRKAGSKRFCSSSSRISPPRLMPYFAEPFKSAFLIALILPSSLAGKPPNSEMPPRMFCRQNNTP